MLAANGSTTALSYMRALVFTRPVESMSAGPASRPGCPYIPDRLHPARALASTAHRHARDHKWSNCAIPSRPDSVRIGRYFHHSLSSLVTGSDHRGAALCATLLIERAFPKPLTSSAFVLTVAIKAVFTLQTSHAHQLEVSVSSTSPVCRTYNFKPRAQKASNWDTVCCD